MFGKFRFIVLTKKKAAAVGAGFLCFGIVICMAVGILPKLSVGAGEIPIYRVKTDEKKIAITFDCAWEDADTDEILSALNDNGAKATFFVTGDYVRRCKESVKKFSGSGHDIGNHSDNHPHPNSMSKEDLIEDTNRCAKEIENLGIEAKKLYRSPYGEYNEKVVQTINSMGYSFIQWDADSLDYRGLTPSEMEERIMKRVKSGSIILFHTGTENTAAALRQILPKLKKRGYSFVTVDELIYKEDFKIDHAGQQIKN